MSYFDSCGECGKQYTKRNYTWNVCKDCLIKNHPEEKHNQFNSEKLMYELTEKLNDVQNDLFSELIELSAVHGKTIQEIKNQFTSYRFLDKSEIKQVFDDLESVLKEHELESKRNFELCSACGKNEFCTLQNCDFNHCEFCNNLAKVEAVQ